jgi:uncharacterized protein
MYTQERPVDPLSELEAFSVKAWGTIAPFWPLKHLIAVNPLQGLEGLPIEEAVMQGRALFQQDTFPQPLEEINRETIKWLQAFYDEGQATIQMPDKHKGLYLAWKQLVVYDWRVHKKHRINIERLQTLPDCPLEALSTCLSYFRLGRKNTCQFLQLLLTTLPGWASFIKYRTEWSNSNEERKVSQSEQMDYLAMRAATTLLLWPEAGEQLLSWGQNCLKQASNHDIFEKVGQTEKNWRLPLLERLTEKTKQQASIKPDAQLVFCIDVRSERMRRAVEASGSYETFGFAGFFGIPTRIKNAVTGESRASCPVLLSAKHEIEESPCCSKTTEESACKEHQRIVLFKQIYLSIKHNFTSPFAMVESLGIVVGLWMAIKTFSPKIAAKFEKSFIKLFQKPIHTRPNLCDLSLADRCAYAEGALKTMGLCDHFAPLVVFCGHGSTTTNNAFASALDCGACGGGHGGTNAQALAAILNQAEVREYFAMKSIFIPESTTFIGALHNTTTDEITLLDRHSSEKIERLQLQLKNAQQLCAKERYASLISNSLAQGCETRRVQHRSLDWAQVRPEWGLAKNAAFIVAPRKLTQNHHLNGRCFLHSYESDKDLDGKSLETILTAPMVVAQWINSQYFFSSLDNISFGSGSKLTNNIVGKFGIMQGNASDLMTGLPLQSVYSSDKESYHELQRLMTVVYAPISKITPIIQKNPILQKLFGNGWVQLVSIDPKNHQVHWLKRDLTWEEQS